jgi:hypothetical protein
LPWRFSGKGTGRIIAGGVVDYEMRGDRDDVLGKASQARLQLSATDGGRPATDRLRATGVRFVRS